MYTLIMFGFVTEINPSQKPTSFFADTSADPIENDLRRVLSPHFKNVYGENYASKLNKIIEQYVKVHGSDLGPLKRMINFVDRNYDNSSPWVYSKNLVDHIQGVFEVRQELGIIIAEKEAAEKEAAEKAKKIGHFGTFNLNGRIIGNGGLPRLEYDGLQESKQEGKIVINITVDPGGNVINAEIGHGTNINDEQIRKSALEAARRAKFNKIQGNSNQNGTIIYIFRLI